MITNQCIRIKEGVFAKPIIFILFLLSTGCTGLRASIDNDEGQVKVKLEKPEVCVAFSGGGLRSSAFSVGVLKALHDSNSLHRIDISSATSGGGWAQLWMHAHLSQGKSLPDIFGKEQFVDSETLRELDNHFFIDGLWRNWTIFWSFLRMGDSAYGAAIWGKFGEGNTGMDDAVRNVVDHKIPVPIFDLATFEPCYASDLQFTRFKEEGPSLAARLAELRPMKDHLVEVTPVGWGSPQLGYTKDFPFSLKNMESVATVASAVVDAPGFIDCQRLRTLGISYGASVQKPKAKASIGGSEIYLADGGFVDNLATKNLVDRKCRTILVSDAEYDPTLIFEGYLRLKSDLKAEDLDLRVEAIDDWLDQRGLGPCPSLLPCFQADVATNPIVRSPVMDGCVWKDGNCLIKIVYVKLAIDPSDVEPSPKSGWRRDKDLQAFFSANSVGGCYKTNKIGSYSCGFPHTPTGKSDYSAEEYRAYRLLGYETITRYNVKDHLFERAAK